MIFPQSSSRIFAFVFCEFPVILGGGGGLILGTIWGVGVERGCGGYFGGFGVGRVARQQKPLVEGFSLTRIVRGNIVSNRECF